MKRSLIVLCAVLVVAAACVAPADPPETLDTTESQWPTSAAPLIDDITSGRTASVERVIDGDTIVVYDGERVRLTGIDTPETVKPGSPVECFGKEASRYLTELLPEGTEVRLVRDVEEFDRYDRTLSYVYVAATGAFVNAQMVAEGYAYAYTYPPNVAHADEFAELQSEAEANNRGLWSQCPVS